MHHRFLSLALFTFYLPRLIAASQCPACDSFTAALKTCQTTGLNITAVGNKMDASTVHCMCVSSSSSTKMADCSYCDGSIDEVTVDGYALMAWYDTCYADNTWGDQQAIACWESLPEDGTPCVENTGGKGSAFTSGGPEPLVSSVSSLIASIFSGPPNPFATESPFGSTSPSATASLSVTASPSGTTTRPATTAASKTAGSSGTPIRPATTSPSTTATPSTETTPSPKSSSEAMMSPKAFGLFSTIFITLGVLLATQ